MLTSYIFNTVLFLGALAAVANFVWTLWQHYRPIRITVPSHTIENGDRGKMTILVRNPRPRSLNIYALRLMVFHKKDHNWQPWSEPIVTNPSLPYSVKDEKRFDIAVAADITFAANILSPFYIEVETEMGEVFRSKKITYTSKATEA